MKYSKLQLWERFQKYYKEFPTIGMALDLSRINFADNFFSEMEPRIQAAFLEMDKLEAGAIANPDEIALLFAVGEIRMVGFEQPRWLAGRDLGFIAAHSANDMAGMVRSFQSFGMQVK